MIYPAADQLSHIASAMESINPEWAMRLKGMANYIRGLESTNINLYNELRESKQTIEEFGNSIPDAESEMHADKIREVERCAQKIRRELAVADEIHDLETVDLMQLPDCGTTLDDLIRSLP